MALNLLDVLQKLEPKKRLVLNSDFDAFSDLVLRYEDAFLISDYEVGDPCYNGEESRRLYERVLSYAQKLNQPIRHQRVIVLVHPFYPFVNSKERFPFTGDIRKYLDGLQCVLSEEFSEKGISRVLFDSAHHYAAISSLLHREGLFDRVFVTEYGHGHVMSRESLALLAGKDIMVGGGYHMTFGQGCHLQAYEDLRVHASPSSLRMISDLTINPFPNIWPKQLFRSSFPFEPLNPGESITLSEILS